MKKTIEFCTYRSQNGLVLVNATDHVLRIKEPDCTIIELPSSVFPQNMDIPDSYKAKAKDLGTNVKKVCDSSLFIKVEIAEMEISQCVYCEMFKSDGVLNIIEDILKYHDKPLIIGTRSAARAFPKEIVEPFYINKKTCLIKADKFRTYKNLV